MRLLCGTKRSADDFRLGKFCSAGLLLSKRLSNGKRQVDSCFSPGRGGLSTIEQCWFAFISLAGVCLCVCASAESRLWPCCTPYGLRIMHDQQLFHAKGWMGWINWPAAACFRCVKTDANWVPVPVSF